MVAAYRSVRDGIYAENKRSQTSVETRTSEDRPDAMLVFGFGIYSLSYVPVIHGHGLDVEVSRDRFSLLYIIYQKQHPIDLISLIP